MARLGTGISRAQYLMSTPIKHILQRSRFISQTFQLFFHDTSDIGLSKKFLSYPCYLTQHVTYVLSFISLPLKANSIVSINCFIFTVLHFSLTTHINTGLLEQVYTMKVYKRKYVHEVLVNCLFKLAQEKVWLGELTVPQ